MTTKDKNKLWHTHQRRYNFLRVWDKRYYHMKARHEGNSTHFSHSNGKGLLSHEEFIKWCMAWENLQEFVTLYFEWAANGFQLWDSPSIDRIDSKKGYVVGNIQWLSFMDNTEKNHKYVDPITKKMVREPLDD